MSASGLQLCPQKGFCRTSPSTSQAAVQFLLYIFMEDKQLVLRLSCCGSRVCRKFRGPHTILPTRKTA